MGFVLPYTYDSLDVVEIAPVFEAYPELSDQIQSLLEDRFSFDGSDTWSVNLPEAELEATFSSDSVAAEIGDEWNFELNWDEGELNLDWTGPGSLLEGLGLNHDSISQSISLSYDLLDLTANADAVTEVDGEKMSDVFEFSGELSDGLPNFVFTWNHESDDELFDIPAQDYSVALLTSSKGDCDFSSNGICSATASVTIEHNDDTNVHTATFVTKPRIAWATYQINDGAHYVIGVRAENKFGKSAAFSDLEYVSVWYKDFPETFARPGKVANSRMGINVVTFPLPNAFENDVLPVLEEVFEPFTDLYENLSENPESIPNFAVYFDLWCDELPKKLGLAEAVKASRVAVWGYPNKKLTNFANSVDLTLMGVTLKNDAISGIWEESREYVQELFGEDGQSTFEDIYL